MAEIRMEFAEEKKKISVFALSLSFLAYGKEQLHTTEENGKNTCKLTTLVSHGY